VAGSNPEAERLAQFLRAQRKRVMLQPAAQESAARAFVVGVLASGEAEPLGVKGFGAIDVTRAVLPAMRQSRRGAIVMMSSVAGKLPIPFASPYCATKPPGSLSVPAMRERTSTRHPHNPRQFQRAAQSTFRR